MTQIKKTYDPAFSQVDLHGDVIDTVHASLHDRTAITDAYEHVLIAFDNEECDHITIELMMSAGNEVEGEVQRKYATIYDGKTW